MSELSDISIEKTAVGGSPTDHTTMQGVSGKASTSSSFSKPVKNTLGKFFCLPWQQIDIKEEDDHDEESYDFGLQLNFNRWLLKSVCNDQHVFEWDATF